LEPCHENDDIESNIRDNNYGRNGSNATVDDTMVHDSSHHHHYRVKKSSPIVHDMETFKNNLNITTLNKFIMKK
jgi:hypothetical protein